MKVGEMKQKNRTYWFESLARRAASLTESSGPIQLTLDPKGASAGEVTRELKLRNVVFSVDANRLTLVGVRKNA